MRIIIDKYILYLFFPFLSFLDFIRFRLYALPIIFIYLSSAIEVQSDSPDINRIFEKLQRYFRAPYEVLRVEFVEGYLGLAKVDFVEDLVLFFVSSITTNQRLALTLMSLIQSLIFLNLLKRISVIWWKTGHKMNMLSILLIFLLCLYNPVALINQFRFWTAC